MLTLRRPTPEQLAGLVRRSCALPLSATPGLLSQHEPGWFVDRHREVVGRGRADFDAARDAIVDWAKFRQNWTVPALPLAVIETGAEVGYSARALGLWWSYTCRITAVGVEPDRFWFDYVTVTGHAERGEERFLVEIDADETVWFELFAKSRPGRWFTWIGLPLARRIQGRFRPGAASAVRRHVDRSRASGDG